MSLKLIDLSHSLYPGMPLFPGDEAIQFSPLNTIEDHGLRLSYLSMSTHTGTHIDAPAHMLENGLYLDQYPLSAFYGQAIVTDCRDGRQIEVDQLRSSLTDQIPDFILLLTRHDRHWGKDSYYSDFPLLTTEAASFLCSLPIKGVGIDAPSFDRTGSESCPVHRLLLEKGILLIENLCRLEYLPASGFIFSCLPLSIVNADGSPVRACGIV